jgi:transcriptional regulator with XRE-family HTH domain
MRAGLRYRPAMAAPTPHHAGRPVGAYLREWRERRRLSQLELACVADISTRHLSFVETGRAHPSRDMVLHLAERLDVPLRERNAILVAAGYAPVFPQRPLDDPALSAAHEAVRLVLAAHEPAPAIAVDRHWQLVAANGAAAMLMAGADPALLQPPINVLRLSLHPRGHAPRILNLAQWRAHIFERLRRQIAVSADPVLAALLAELEGYLAPPVPENGDEAVGVAGQGGFVVPLRLTVEDRVLTFLSTTTVFGTPVDVTLEELAIESFFPADATTADALRYLAMKG